MGNEHAQRDYTRLASQWLRVLGVVQLIGLDLAGLLLIWLGTELRKYRSGVWWAAVTVSSLYVAMATGMAVWAIAAGTSGTPLSIYGMRYEGPPIWAVWLLTGAILVAHGVPLSCLLMPGTRAAFVQARIAPTAARCPNCQYNLTGNVTGQCPECGQPVHGADAESRPRDHQGHTGAGDGAEPL